MSKRRVIGHLADNYDRLLRQNIPLNCIVETKGNLRTDFDCFLIRLLEVKIMFRAELLGVG